MSLPETDDHTSCVVRRGDGSLLISGNVTMADLNHFLQADFLAKNNPFYSTVAGFSFHKSERLPEVGEVLEHHGHWFEVVDMNGAKIDKVILKKMAELG